MKNIKERPHMQCPNCNRTEKQIKMGYNRSGTQGCKRKACGVTYTLHPKNREYSEEIKEQAIKTYYSGVSGRGVGKLFNMSKVNVYNWIKKNGT